MVIVVDEVLFFNYSIPGHGLGKIQYKNKKIKINIKIIYVAGSIKKKSNLLTNSVVKNVMFSISRKQYHLITP